MQRKLFAVAIAAIATLTAVPSWAADQDDKETAQRIATVLRDSGQMKAYSIGVKYKEGTAWLAGRVTDKEQAAAALEIVSNIDGVEQIVNNLTVAPPAEATTSGRKAAPIRQAPEVQLVAAEQAVPQRRVPQAPARPQGQPRPAQRAQQAGGYKMMPPAQMAQNMPAQPTQGYGRPLPAYQPGQGGQVAPATYNQANMPNYAWPSYAAYPNYAALSYPKQYSASAFPFIGPFYPYPQVPLGWRRVSLEWDDGWWFLDFDDRGCQ